MGIKIRPAYLSILVTIFIGVISAPIFYNWFIRPIIVVDIKEFELPKVYNDTIEDKQLKIPRISIIEITNIGKSIGGILSLDFRTNNNTILQSVSVESRSNVLEYNTEEAKDGSSIIKLDMEYIRPKEKVIIKALTAVKANFILNQKLITSGEVLVAQDYDRNKGILNYAFLVIFALYSALLGIVIDAFFEKRLGNFLLKKSPEKNK